MLCHTDDPLVAEFRLPRRKIDLQASVHGKTESGPLDCHSCHDPHVFQPANDPDDPLERIARSNAICLACHGPDADPRRRFARDDATPKHVLFPNFANHQRKVKCVVCHTSRDEDAGGTRHAVLARDRSLRECEACHAPASPILDAVYGPQRLGAKAALARLSGPTRSTDAYVIGSSRSPELERLSVVGFGVTCALIALHGLARVVQALRSRRSGERG